MTTTRLPKPFEPDELGRLYAAASSRPDVAAAMRFLHETGLRISEACAISSTEAGAWPRPPAWCRRPTCRRHRRVLRVIGKGDRERVIVLTPPALRAAAVLVTASRNGHLFPWTDRGVRYLFAEVGARAGVHCHPHRFRHQFVTELIESGVPIEVAADMAGHSKTEITRLYWTASERTKVAALSRRGRWLRRR
jgi:integrase/recombinase XerC